MKQLLLLLFSTICLLASAQIVTWDSVMDVSTSDFGNEHPRVVVDGSGNPMILWGDSDKAMFARWNGFSFDTPVRMNPIGVQIFAQSWAGPDIAAKGDTVYVIYKQSPEDVNHIYLVRSYDGGVTFILPPVEVDTIGTDLSRFPTITVDDVGNPIVAFMKFDSAFSDARWVVTKSSDYGSTFTPDVVASNWSGGDVCDCCPGSIVSEGNTVAMLYRDNMNNIRDSWVGISNDGGSSFTNGWNIDAMNWMLMMCPSTGPDGVIIGDSLYSVFMNGASATTVYWSASSLSTMQKGPTKPLTGVIPGLASQNYPRIANDGNAVAVVWKQRVNNSDQLAMRFTNNISNSPLNSYTTVAMAGVMNTDVAVHDGNVFVVWEDMNSGTVKYRKGIFNPFSTSISSIQYNAFQLIASPNPSSNAWTVEGNTNTNITDISLYNCIGEQLTMKPFTQNGNHISIIIENTLLPKGVYILRVSNEKNSQSIRLLKE